MPAHVRKGDLVMVVSGEGSKEKQTGKVLRVIPADQKVVVEGVNVRKKHIRPSQQNPRGGMIEKEMPIHISNVMPVVDGKPTRVRFETRPDGSKVRIAVVNGQPFGPELRKARK
jgi:large subunit ribosomal protein L24